MSQRTLVLLAVLVPVAGLLSLFGWQMVRTGGQPAGIGINSVFGEVQVEPRAARPFSLTLLSGSQTSLADLRGKVVMIDFWSSWCPPCREEAPTLASVYQQYQARGVVFLGVAIWDSDSEVRKFVQGNGLGYPNGLESRGTIAIDYGVKGIPEKYFVDKNGNIVRKFIGPVTSEQLSKVLDELLAR